ncbi:PaaI family thioesterase [Parasphingorhabdus pacifica]
MTALPTTELTQLLETMPFAEAVGIRLDSAADDEVRGHLPWKAERCTAGGMLHGGALMTLADSTGAICAYLNLPECTTTTTIESKTNFFRGMPSGVLHAISRPLHVGRTTIAIHTELFDDRQHRIGHTSQTQAIVPTRP